MKWKINIRDRLLAVFENNVDKREKHIKNPSWDINWQIHSRSHLNTKSDDNNNKVEFVAFFCPHLRTFNDY